MNLLRKVSVEYCRVGGNMQTYTLDLETLLALLEEAGQTGRLSTELPSGVPGFKERCQARVDLQGGKVVSCQLGGRNGRILISGNKALQLLSHLGPYEWQLVETQLDGSFPTPTPTPTPAPIQVQPPGVGNLYALSVVPRRTAYFDQRALDRLSRRHRRVLSLVDNVRSVEKIASLLSASPDTQFLQQVRDIVQELEAMGMITINS